MKSEKPTTCREDTSKKLMKFTCPECGSNRLEEVVLMRQEIEGVYDPEDPDYDWHYDFDGMVVITRTVYGVSSEANFYRCYDCETSLTDEDGREFWGAGGLYRWLKGLPIHEEYEEAEEEGEGGTE
jgi:DNA-directed RNA polymerase subunit RPC12/RpoP